MGVVSAPSSPRLGSKRIAVAGNPNCGKTTLFNALTGLRHKVGNYPGVTVEKREGVLSGSDATLLDLPGAYSLSGRSPDEQIARDVLLGRIEGLPRPDGVLLVIDGSNLERNLYLASQILDFAIPVVIACNMMDMAAERGQYVDCKALSRELGVPVVPTVADRDGGVSELRLALEDIERSRPPPRHWRLTQAFERAVEGVAATLEKARATPLHTVRGGALLWLCDYLSGEKECRRSAERLLAKLQDKHAEALRAAAAELQHADGDATAAAIEARYAWVSEVARRVVRMAAGDQTSKPTIQRTLTDRLDAVFTHKVLGPLVFAAVVFVVFTSVFAGAEPLMGLIESGQEGLAAVVGPLFPEGPLRSLVSDGIIAGAGAVVVFFPQICLLFLFLSILEDSGYMARAALIMDRLMSRAGLAGKSFIPLLSSYACAIPGIMATRTIEDRRDRFTTIMVAPLMSCSARLPVYLTVIGAVFGDRTWLKAGVLFGLYLLGTVVALVMALVFKKTLFAGPRPTFIMELPAYHMPRPLPTLRAMWDRSKVFLSKAGTIIFAVCVIVWALSYFPRASEAEFPPETRARLAAMNEGQAEARANVIASERLRLSYIGRLGRAIEPAIEPLGFDWRLGIGVLSSFLAREVFVGTMGITFAVGEATEESTALREKLAAATWPDGRAVLTPLVGVGLMVFYVLACQCVSTLAVVSRETNSWRWPALLFAYMGLLAYVAALAIHQVGLLLGLGRA